MGARMGFYVRKSVKAGPFRFNLSTSGLGVSVGVPGFRVTAGPRGNYVTVGRDGVYYRATLAGQNAQNQGASPQVIQQLPTCDRSGVVLEDVTGTTVVAMEPTGGGDVVEQLNAAASRLRFGWPLAALAFVFGLLAGMPLGIIIWVVLAPVCVWLILRDQARRSVVLFYDVGDEPARWFASVVEQWPWVSGSQKLWREIQSGAVATTYQFKTNSGASNVVSRQQATAHVNGPKELATNIYVPTISAGSAALYFLPDRVLVRDGKKYSDISYSHLCVSAGQTQFTESSAPPSDGVQIGHTWRYVNVKGGPDRRYKDNPVLPIMLYSTIDLTTPEGLRWHLQLSRKDAARSVVHVLSASPAVLGKSGPLTATLAPPAASPQARQSSPAPVPSAAQSAPPQIVRLVATKPEGRRNAIAKDSGVVRAHLSRSGKGHPMSETTFTAIDVETTGLDSEADRIVEIGLVKFTADGTVVDEFATLINNPGSSAGARETHGIHDADLVRAPSTEQVLAEVFAFIAGTVLVAHNLDFEEGFLSGASRRAGISMPSVVGVCTLQTSRRQLDGRAFSLFAMYKTATGNWHDHKHTALGDARAVREVLLWMLRTSPTTLRLTKSVPTLVPPAFQPCSISCRPVPLVSASVTELLDSFPQSSTRRAGDPVEIEKYLALLADAVEDGRLTYDEAAALTEQACLTRLTGPQLRELHYAAWQEAFSDVDGREWTSLTPVRRREMYLLADSLGLSELAGQINEVIQACAEPIPPAEGRYLKGLRIAIVGDHGEIVDLRKRAEMYGAKLAINVTKTVEWLATSTPDADDSRHNTARRLGIPIISSAQASTRLDDAIAEAELKAFERQRQVDEYAASRRQRQAEADAYWRPTWRAIELDRDPEFESWQ